MDGRPLHRGAIQDDGPWRPFRRNLNFQRGPLNLGSLREVLPGMSALRAVVPTLLLGCTAGLACLAEDQPAAQVQPATSEEQGPRYAEPTRLDRAGRILARVDINGHGPYRFIIDTGANRSAIAPHVIRGLGLQPHAGDGQPLHGVTGSAVLPWVDIDSLRAGGILLEPRPMPVLDGAVFADADGILGIEGFQNARIAVDFDRDRVEISESAGQRASRGALRVPVRLKYGGLLVADGKVAGIPVQVIIDTGAEHSLGNAALHAALLQQVPRHGEGSRRTIIGATTETSSGLAVTVPSVKIGDASLLNLSVTFGDLHVFRIWGLEDEPAILVGMDLIGTLQRFVVDYRRQEIHLQARKRVRTMSVRKCGPGQCQTRIPVSGD